MRGIVLPANMAKELEICRKNIQVQTVLAENRLFSPGYEINSEGFLDSGFVAEGDPSNSQRSARFVADLWSTVKKRNDAEGVESPNISTTIDTFDVAITQPGSTKRCPRATRYVAFSD